jgi:hypothetical protein
MCVCVFFFFFVVCMLLHGDLRYLYTLGHMKFPRGE